jgi:hypothetical protein
VICHLPSSLHHLTITETAVARDIYTFDELVSRYLADHKANGNTQALRFVIRRRSSSSTTLLPADFKQRLDGLSRISDRLNQLAFWLRETPLIG